VFQLEILILELGAVDRFAAGAVEVCEVAFSLSKKTKVPPCAMNRLMMRWKMEFLKPNPFSPVQSTLKFSAVFGTTLAKSSKVIL